MRVVSEELLIETLAEVAHEVWVDWAKALIHAHKIVDKAALDWEQFFVAYRDLREPAKELDRTVARKYIAALKKLGVV